MAEILDIVAPGGPDPATQEGQPLTQSTLPVAGAGKDSPWHATSQSILNEFVKSYGVRYDKEADSWSWSAENVGKAFDEEPIWTSIDYATLSIPAANWGLAAARVARGTGAAGRSWRGIDAATGAASSGPLEGLGTREGLREFGKLTGLARRNSVARNRFTQGVSSGATTHFDPEYIRLMDKYGADPAEIRGLYKVAERDLKINMAATERLKEDALRAMGRTDDATRNEITRLLENPETVAELGPGGVRELLGETGERAWQKTVTFRDNLHERAFSAGLISEETYLSNLGKYAPRRYEEFVKNEVVKHGRFTAKSGFKSPSNSFLARTAEEHPELSRIWDPKLGVLNMATAADTVAKQEFAQRLAGSAIAKDVPDILGLFGRLRDADPAYRQAMGMSDDVVDVIAKHGGLDGLSDEAAAEILETAGWKRMADLYPADKLPGYVARLPEDLLGKWIDPVAARDLDGMLEYMSDGSNTKFLNRAYSRVLSTFRASKTAYNPATHMRNYLGNVVFHHFATGGAPSFLPRAGIAAMRSQDEAYEAAVRAGVVGSSFDREVQEAIVGALSEIDPKAAERIAAGQASALDFLGNSKVAQYVQGGAGKAEKFYRAIDEAWKLDAFINLRKRGLAKGLTEADAAGQAALTINKFMPQFTMHSEAADTLRKGIPFFSFTNEAFRVWRNAIMERPLQAYGWLHMADAASYTTGAMNGMSPEEVDAYREFMPEYQRNKMMALLPFKIDGKPNFLDLSYLIPMGNIAEMQKSENLFFGIVDPSANPVVNIAAAGTTQVDPFTGRSIEPRFTENTLGIRIEDETARYAVGMAEHVASTMLPPLMPPGFAANNLIELVRGDVNTYTGTPLEPDYRKTLAGNLFGLRIYEAGVGSQSLNVRAEEKRLFGRRTDWAHDYTRRQLRGDVAGMDRAKRNYIDITNRINPGTGEDAFGRMTEKSAPGSYRSMGTRQLTETVRRSQDLQKFGPLSSKDQEDLGNLMSELQRRTSKKR